MSKHFLRSALALATLAAASATATAAVHDTVFRAGFEELAPADVPANDAEAARFLTQATFGPTPSEIALVRQLGYSHWLDRQLGMPITAVRPHMQALDAQLNLMVPQQDLNQNHRVDFFYLTALQGRDQLRQRMAWALSQIFVVSDQNGAIGEEYINLSEYWDLLARGGTGNYRQLLNDVTFSPTMGKYLSHFRNRKASTTTPIRLPDENYAREVMQLFSVGLIERNLDFSPMLIGGQPVATYDQDTISQMAKLFTGFNYNDATTIFNGTNTYLPMSCIQAEHDLTAKTVLGDVVLPANQACGTDVGLMLNVINLHPNVGPFISRQLIQRFVTSTPSAAHIQRVATVFQNNGSGERGDLGAVLRAILLDADARNAAPPTSFGKLREPVLRLTALWRAWDAVAPAPYLSGTPPVQQPPLDIRISNSARGMSQTPLRAPTVFNFYVPDYQPPGAIMGGLFAPEFQITNESSVWAVGNTMFQHSYNAYVGLLENPPGTPAATPDTAPLTRPSLDLAPLTILNGNPAAMIDLVNVRMMYGSMTTPTRNALTTMLTSAPLSTDTAINRARSLVYVASLAPEFATQR